MARRQKDGTDGNERRIDRRSLLKAAGGTAAAVGLGSSLTGASAAATVVDLGSKGLSSGDTIDPYLEDHFVSGNEVHIPPGEYNYSGAGLGGEKSDCALIGSPDGVVFHRPDDPDETVRPTTVAESGTVRVENITIKGKHGEEQSRWRMDAAEGATMEAVNVNFPDGTVDGSDSTGIYAGTDHAGTLWVKNCYFSNFGNVALYVSDPYKGGNGPVIVEDCAFVNTGMSALRFASDDSVARRCYFEATEKGPAGNTGWNQRGIKIDDAGENVVIEDIDIYWTDAGTYPVQFDDKGEGGAGTMRNMRIYNSSDNTTFKKQWDGISENWSGTNIQLTGGADHNAPSSFETITSGDAAQPNREYAIWTPVDGATSPDGPQAGAGSGSSDGSDGSGGATEGKQLVLEASQDNPDTNLDVSFTATDEISFGAEAEPSTDKIVENDDGTYTATSVKMNPGARDSYRVLGEITGYSVTEGYDVTVSVDGQATTFEDLVGSGSDGSTGSGSGDSSEGSGGSTGGSSGSDSGSQKRLVVDGTGDATESAIYEFSVSGDLQYDAAQSTLVDGGLAWDKLPDTVSGGTATGVVGYGKDVYWFSGTLQSANIDGEAVLKILEG